MQHLETHGFFRYKRGAFRIGSRQSRRIFGFTSASCRSSREQLGIFAKSLSHEIADSSLPVIEHKLKYPKNMDLISKEVRGDMSFIKTFIQKVQRQLSGWISEIFRWSTTVNSVNHSGCHVYYVITSIYQGSFHYQTPTNVHKRRIKRKSINMYICLHCLIPPICTI